MRLWQGSFSPDDFERMAHIGKSHGHDALSESIRMAIRLQATRDEEPVGPTRKLKTACKIALASCVEMRGHWARANANPATMEAAGEANASRIKLRRWSFRCHDDDLSRLDVIREKHSLSKRSEAARFALHVQAVLDGYGE